MNKAIKSDLVRGHKVNNIPTVEFELTLEQVEEINEVCKNYIEGWDDVPDDFVEDYFKNNDIEFTYYVNTIENEEN